MDFKKMFLSVGFAACFGFVACSSDSSSGSDDNGDGGSSSSAGEVIDLPEANGDSLISIDFKVVPTTATTVKFTGSVIVYTAKDTTVHLDSILFKIGNASGYEISTANFSVQSYAYDSTTKILSIGNALAPTLDLSSFSDCGSLYAYVIVYASSPNIQAKIVAKDTASFDKTCPDGSSSSVSSSSITTSDAAMTAWDVTLSTTATADNGVDLDGKTLYLSSALEANKELVDLYLVRESGSPILYTNAYLDAVSGSQIAEETKSTANYADYPSPAYISAFGYSESALTISADDFATITSYVVITSSFNASTGKGFFVVLPHSPVTSGSDVSLTLTVLGIW